MLELALIVGVLAVVLGLATFRPWVALVVALALVPFNGLLVDVILPGAGFTSNAATAAAAWHDALVGGVILAATYRWLRGRPSRRLGPFELAVALTLVAGTVSLLI